MTNSKFPKLLSKINVVTENLFSCSNSHFHGRNICTLQYLVAQETSPNNLLLFSLEYCSSDPCQKNAQKIIISRRILQGNNFKFVCKGMNDLLGEKLGCVVTEKAKFK